MGQFENTGDVAAALAFAESRLVASSYTQQDGSIVTFYAGGMSKHTDAPVNPVLPERVKAGENFVEPDSLALYVNRFKTLTTILMASLSRRTITARLDYHHKQEGMAVDSDFNELDIRVPKPQLDQHHAALKCEFDPDYAKWRALFGQQIDQQTYAEFIEDMLHTIAQPPAADLLDAVSELKLHRDAKFSNKVDLRGGKLNLTYEEDDTQVSGKMALPESIVIVCPMYQGDEPIAIHAKLRYRLKDGVLRFIIAVPGIEKLERDQFRQIVDYVGDKTAVPVFYTA